MRIFIHLINWLIDFNGMSTFSLLFKASNLGNPVSLNVHKRGFIVWNLSIEYQWFARSIMISSILI